MSEPAPQNISYIAIQELNPNPLQPRGSITSDSLEDLIESIRQHGVLEPLVAAETPAGLQIIAGERRWRASKIVGLTQVPVIIKKTTPQGMLEMAIVENVQRSDLNPLERAKAFERLMKEFGLSNSEVSRRIGKSAAYISNTLRLLALPDALKDGLLTGMITEGHGRALAAIEDPHLMIEAYKIILRESGSVRSAEELARRMRSKSGQAAKTSPKTPLIVNEEIDKIRDDLLTKLGGEKSNIVKLSRSRTETKLVIHLKGNVEQTDPRLKLIYDSILLSAEVPSEPTS